VTTIDLPQAVKRESERFAANRQRSESANPAVNYRETRPSEDVAEDLSRPMSSSYPHQHHPRPLIHVAAASAHLPEDSPSPMKLPPPAHSHHRRTDAPDHILADSGMRHRSPARNMPSPRGYSDHLPTEREDVPPWPVRRTVPPPLPYLPPTPCSITSTTVAAAKFNAAASGPPPLIHEPVKGVSGAGSIVLGTPLSPEQRRRHFELPPAVGMLYKNGNDPTVMRSGYSGPLISQPPPPPPQAALQEGHFPIIARQTSMPWPPSHMQQPSVIRTAGSDVNVATSSRDLLYGDLMTARQMQRSQLAGLTDPGPDRRRVSPRSAGLYATPSWQHAPRGGRSEPAAGPPRHLDDIHRADILNMLPWPVRPPPANMARYSVCGEPSRQCYTPPLPIQKAFVSHDAVPGTLPSRHDNTDLRASSRFAGPKISPRYKDTVDSVTEWRHSEVRRSPSRDSKETSVVGGGHRPDSRGTVQTSASGASEKLTAASLIDAIIIDQINQDLRPPAGTKAQHPSPGRAAAAGANTGILERLSIETSTSDQFMASRSSPLSSDRQHQCPPKSSPGGAAQSVRKDLTLGEHIHSIIMHDFKQKDVAVASAGSAFNASARIGKISCL